MEVLGTEDVRRFLAARGLDREIHTFTESTENAYLAARALGVDLGQIVKSVLLLADERPVLVLVSGDMNVHTRKLKKILGARKVKMADGETVLEATGYPVGGVPPVAHRQEISTYIDESLKRFPEIYPAAGTASSMFSTTFDELRLLTSAAAADVSKPRNPG